MQSFDPLLPTHTLQLLRRYNAGQLLNVTLAYFDKDYRTDERNICYT